MAIPVHICGENGTVAACYKNCVATCLDRLQCKFSKMPPVLGFSHIDLPPGLSENAHGSAE